MKKRVTTFLIAVMLSFTVIAMTSYHAYSETDSTCTEESNECAEEEPENPDCCLPPSYVKPK